MWILYENFDIFKYVCIDKANDILSLYDEKLICCEHFENWFEPNVIKSSILYLVLSKK